MSVQPPEDDDPTELEGYTEEELDQIWSDLSEDEKQEVADSYPGWAVDEWDTLSAEEKYGVLENHGYAESDQVDDIDEDTSASGNESRLVKGVPLALDNELTLVGENDATVTIAGIDIPGAYLYRRKSEGKEAQYLEETRIDGDGNPYNADNPPEEDTDSDDESNSDETPSGGDEPPLTIIVEAHIGYETLRDLRELREREDTFNVLVEGLELEDMELVEVDTEVTGENPYDLDAIIEVREWREYEAQGTSGSGTPDYGQDSGEDEEGDAEDLTDVEESGSPDEPNEITVAEGETREIHLEDGDRLRNVRIDATASGADANITTEGDNWTIKDVSIDGVSEGEPAINAASGEGGEGTIEDVYVNGEPVEGDGSGNYEVIEARGQVIRLEDGETFENVLIDLGDRNDIDIIATGTNWTIRNVGVTGTWHHDTHDYIFNLADTGGNTSTIENVYIGEGDPPSASQRGGCIWVPSEHSGHLEVHNVNFNVEGALGIYGHYPGTSGGGGTIDINGCYAKDCHHTAYRVADNGNQIRNSVAYKSGNYAAQRGIWLWEGYGGGTTIENVDIITNGEGASLVTNGSPEYTTTDFNTDDGHGGTPEDYVPGGCPTDAQMAASGSTDGSPSNPGSGSSFTEIQAEGQTVEISDGETYENVLVDMTTGDFQIDATNATDWTIRNVGFKGRYEGMGFPLAVSDDAGNTSRIENVYMADGAEDNGLGLSTPGGIYVSPNHTGEIEIVRCNVQGFPNNGYYCSNGDGTVTFENCFGRNNGISTFRCGTGGSDTLTNCVAYNDAEDWDGTPLWVWNDSVTVTESNFEAGTHDISMNTRDGGHIDFQSGNYSGNIEGDADLAGSVGTDTDLSRPEGVPRTAEEAAGNGYGVPDIGDIPRADPTDEGWVTETLNRDEHREITLGDGEELTNTIYNITRNGASVTIRASGQDWAIRNVGFEGPQSGQNISIIAEDTGGSSEIDNVYLGDGVEHHPADDQPSHGIYVTSNHTGDLDIMGVGVYGARDNAIDTADAPGSVSIGNCYTLDCLGAHYRIADDELVNCVAVNRENGRSGTCLRVLPGDGSAVVDTCDFVGGGFEPVLELGESGAETTVEMENTHYTSGSTLEHGTVTLVDNGDNGHSPQDEVPEAVAYDAEEAASGGVVDPQPSVDAPEYTGPDVPPAIYIDPERHNGQITIDRTYIRGYEGGGIVGDIDREDSGWISIKNTYITATDGPAISLGSTRDREGWTGTEGSLGSGDITPDVEMEYDGYTTPAEVYDASDLIFDNNITRVNERSVEAPAETGETNIGQALINVGEAWPFDVNQHGFAEAIRVAYWQYIPQTFDHDDGVLELAVPAMHGYTDGWSVRSILLPTDDDQDFQWQLGERVYNELEEPTETAYETFVNTGWTHFEHEVVVNTYADGTANSDGETRTWVDGELAYEETDWAWATAPDEEIERTGFGVSFTTGSPSNQSLYFDGHKMRVNRR